MCHIHEYRIIDSNARKLFSEDGAHIIEKYYVSHRVLLANLSRVDGTLFLVAYYMIVR